MTKIYVAYNKNENERLNSSSGGVFCLLAKYILTLGGSVFGAAYDENFHVSHIEVTETSELHYLLGSKYVQSKMGKNVSLAVKERLESGKKVLFCGTPCQTESIVKFVGNDLRKNLIAVDFTCHGTPLPEVWEAYLAQLKKKGKIVSVNMRQKRFGWKTYSLEVRYSNGKCFSEIFTWNHYSQAFLMNYSLRKPCFHCAFRNVVPNSDITLGDYWDIAQKHPEMNDDKGISKLYVHTDKGETLLKDISDALVIKFDKEIVNYKTKGQNIDIPIKRELFLNTLKNEGFEVAYRKSIYQGIAWNLKLKIKGLLKILLHYKNN